MLGPFTEGPPSGCQCHSGSSLLGETPLSEGTVRLASPEVAFRNQTPWITNDTLQRNVVGFSRFDPGWYSSVITASALDHDIDMLPKRDQSMLGSNGFSLSGGQKQRVAIARAVYFGKQITLFGDVFAGLDSDTQKQVLESVFGPYGLLGVRGNTVVIVTHAVYLLPYANHIIALNANGEVAEQGTFEQFSKNNQSFSEYLTESAEPEIEPAQTRTPEPNAKKEKNEVIETTEEANPKEDLDTVIRDRAVYKYYFATIGIRNTIIFFALQLVWAFLTKFPEIWLSWWGQVNQKTPNQDVGK